MNKLASTIWEFFAIPTSQDGASTSAAAASELCPITQEKCQKSFNDRVVSGVCSIKPITSQPVICCPIRLYADDYKILRDIATRVFGPELPLKRGDQALDHASLESEPCVAVFGQGWGGELRLPQKSGRGGYFVDWVLAKISAKGELVEFVAVEVQTIDTTGTYRDGFEALKQDGSVEKTTAGLNWENVSKRIMPQLVYKGQVLQREELCKQGLFFVCPEPVLERILNRLGGADGLVKYALQPASITFMSYDYDNDAAAGDGQIVPLKNVRNHSTTVYKVQEAFNNVTLPDENVYRDAVLKGLGVKPIT